MRTLEFANIGSQLGNLKCCWHAATFEVDAAESQVSLALSGPDLGGGTSCWYPSEEEHLQVI